MFETNKVVGVKGYKLLHAPGQRRKCKKGGGAKKSEKPYESGNLLFRMSLISGIPEKSE